MTSLEVRFAGLRLDNPTMLASGIMGETGASLLKAAEAGAGALVTKSIGLALRKGYSNPTLVELQDGYINAMGLPGPGIDAFKEEMEEAGKSRVPIIGSLFAAVPKDFITLSIRMQEYGAAAVELNLSCPHAKGYGMEIGVDPDAVKEIVRQVKDAVAIPVLAKITPNTHRLVEVGKAVEAAGGDGIVAINTVKAMAISIEMRRPVLQNKFGGLSGPAVKAVGLRCVYDLYEAVDIPIIGVGGVESGRDAMEYIMAGAVAVQIGSGVGRKGLDVFKSVCSDLQGLMERDGAKSIEKLVGAAHVQ